MYMYRLLPKNKQKCDKMANFQDGNDFHLSNRQTKKLLTTVRMSRFKIQSLSFAWPWKIWVRVKTRPTAYLKRKLPCWGSLEKNTNTRWHLRRVSDYIVVSPQLRLISKKEEGGREEPEILGFGPFSETFSTLKTQTPRRRHLELPKRC